MIIIYKWYEKFGDNNGFHLSETESDNAIIVQPLTRYYKMMMVRADQKLQTITMANNISAMTATKM